MTEKPINLIERLGTIRDEAWHVKINHAWGDIRWLNFAQRIYDLCREVVGPNPRDTNP